MNYKVDVLADGYVYGKCIPLQIKVDHSDFKSIESEIVKYDLAIQKTIKQLNDLKDLNPDLSEYIMMEILIVSDSSLSQHVHKLINNSYCARDAIEEVLTGHIKSINASSSTYLRERSQDIEDIMGRIIYNLENVEFDDLEHDKYVLFLEELYPSILIQRRKNILGVIARKGGYTSHAAIMCRSFGIPLVITDIKIESEVDVIVDTRRQLLITNPDSDEVVRYFNNHLEDNLNVAVEHKDFLFLANISNNSEIDMVLENHFDGIGLYRTEMIFMNLDRPYTLSEQYKIYLEAIDRMKERFIVFRTFDISEDKRIEYLKTGSRGIKTYIDNPEIFENQVTAIMMANKFNNARIMFPMIETNADFEYLRDWVLRICKKNGFSTPLIGMMLETKSALEHISEFVKTDFISVGTNDLTKDLFGIDRNNSFDVIKEHFIDLITLLKPVVEFCDKNNKCLSVCGELASIVDIAVNFYKIGIKNLSVSPSMMKMLNKRYIKYNKK